MIDDLPVDITG